MPERTSNSGPLWMYVPFEYVTKSTSLPKILNRWRQYARFTIQFLVQKLALGIPLNGNANVLEEGGSQARLSLSHDVCICTCFNFQNVDLNASLILRKTFWSWRDRLRRGTLNLQRLARINRPIFGSQAHWAWREAKSIFQWCRHRRCYEILWVLCSSL